MASKSEHPAPPSWMEPQLATLTHEPFSDPDWVFERKLDGERCLAFAGPDGIRLMSRTKHDVTTTFPEIAGALTVQRQGDFVADGEIVAFDGAQTRFGRLQQRRGYRTRDWLKFKCENAQEFVIGGYTDPQRSRSYAIPASRACATTSNPAT